MLLIQQSDNATLLCENLQVILTCPAQSLGSESTYPRISQHSTPHSSPSELLGVPKQRMPCGDCPLDVLPILHWTNLEGWLKCCIRLVPSSTNATSHRHTKLPLALNYLYDA